MKSFIKLAAMAAFVAASVGIVACNNNTRSLEAAAEKVEAPEVEVPVAVEPTGDPAIAEYTLAMIDQQDSTQTFPVQGQLNKTAANSAYFNFLPDSLDSSFVYVSRVASAEAVGGQTRDFAFVFQEGENMRLSTGTLYVEHQSLDNYLYKIPFVSIPNFAVLADNYNTSKEQLMDHMVNFLNEQQIEIHTPGILYLEGHNLSEDFVDRWIIDYETDMGMNI